MMLGRLLSSPSIALSAPLKASPFSVHPFSSLSLSLLSGGIRPFLAFGVRANVLINACLIRSAAHDSRMLAYTGAFFRTEDSHSIHGSDHPYVSCLLPAFLQNSSRRMDVFIDTCNNKMLEKSTFCRKSTADLRCLQCLVNPLTLNALKVSY